MGVLNESLAWLIIAALVVAPMALNPKAQRSKKDHFLSLSDKKKTGAEDASIQVNCSVHGMKKSRFELSWELGQEDNVDQVQLSPTLVQLRVKSLRSTNAGPYVCLLVRSDGLVEKAKFELFVQQANGDVCSKFQFKCKKTKQCLFLRYRCDNMDDCGDGSDEECDVDPCLNKFRCNNSRCVDHMLVCDHVDHCGDLSDEYHNCNAPARIKPASTTEPVIDDKEQFTWLQVAMSIFIVVVVGLVLLVSCIVIMVFRARVRRRRELRATRTLQQMFQQHGDGSVDQSAPNQRQFLLGPSHPHFGNIIVNVNNGVQYIPGYGDCPLMMDVPTPPPYSEVGDAGDSTGPAPPPYSTLERRAETSDESSVRIPLQGSHSESAVITGQSSEVGVAAESIDISPGFLQSLLSPTSSATATSITPDPVASRSVVPSTPSTTPHGRVESTCGPNSTIAESAESESQQQLGSTRDSAAESQSPLNPPPSSEDNDNVNSGHV